MSKNKSSLFSTATKYRDASLLCVFSEEAHLMDNFPGELCDYLVFQSVEYMLAFDRVAIHNVAGTLKRWRSYLEMNDTVPVVCMSVNLAVQHFRTRKRALVGDHCVREEWEDYSQVCADDGPKAIVNWEWLSAISSNVTVTRTFEVPRTLTMKANQFLQLNPKGCLAAFNVDYDDPHGTCPGKQPFSRISTLANLRHATGSRHSD
ncbi:hypothetical protein MRX96_007864 [Rhipicephalus microplus]